VIPLGKAGDDSLIRALRPSEDALTLRGRVALTCGAALVGFAANSLLARGALGLDLIDASTFTVLRLASGALLLGVVVYARGGRPMADGSWRGGAALLGYAAAFSFSYVRIGAALGALVLFPTVKLALLAWGAARGEHPARIEWLGAATALAGLVMLTLPGVGRADLPGIGLMASAGLAWAAYTVEGRRMTQPMGATAGNFLRASLLAAPLPVVGVLQGHATAGGVLLAVLSGSIASALGYVLWYSVVPQLSAVQLGLAQLAVPALAGLGAVVLLGEHLTGRFLAAAAAIFLGIWLALSRGGGARHAPVSPPE